MKNFLRRLGPLVLGVPPSHGKANRNTCWIMWTTFAVALAGCGAEAAPGSLDAEGNFRGVDFCGVVLLLPYVLYAAVGWWNRAEFGVGLVCLGATVAAVIFGIGVHWNDYQDWRDRTARHQQVQSFALAAVLVVQMLGWASLLAGIIVFRITKSKRTLQTPTPR